MIKLLLQRSSLLYMKWSILFFVLAFLGASYLYIKVDTINQRADLRLRASQQRLNESRQQVARIEQEEATIIEYIDRYRQLQREGVLQEEDRLLFKENFARIKDGNNLFPIQLKVAEQQRMALSYPPEATETGGPLDLRFSRIEFSVPLLHEQDLIRLLTSLTNTPGVYQTRKCSIESNYNSEQNYFYLAQHFTGKCELYWYTFDTDPQVALP